MHISKIPTQAELISDIAKKLEEARQAMERAAAYAPWDSEIRRVLMSKSDKEFGFAADQMQDIASAQEEDEQIAEESADYRDQIRGDYYAAQMGASS